MPEEIKENDIIIDVEASINDDIDDGIDPAASENIDWKEQSAYLIELEQLLKEPIPKDEMEYTQSQAATKADIPRPTVPRLIEQYAEITEPLKLMVKSGNNTFVTERGVEFLRLIRKLRDTKLTHAYLKKYVQSVIENRPLTHTLNQADFETIATIIRQMMQAYTEKIIVPSIKEKDDQIQKLTAENAELKNEKVMIEDQSQTYQSLLDKNEELALKVNELSEQNSAILAKLDNIEASREDASQEEHKGFFSRIFGR